MKLPLLTRELVWKLDYMHALLDVDRLGGLAGIEGNPWRIEMKRFGRATAFASTALRSSYYNKVLGFGALEAEALDEIADFFVSTRAPTCRIDILPHEIDETLADRLSDHGLRQVEFHAGYYGLPDVGGAAFPAGVEVRAVESDNDLDVYLEIFHRGWEFAPDTLDVFKHTMRYWRGLADWHHYLACLEGVPRGVGLMMSRDGIAYLAIATTLHQFRGRGCERALIHHAIQHAAALGCELVCGQCDAGSPSGRNFERVGMRLAYHKAIWLFRPPPGADEHAGRLEYEGANGS